MHVDHQAGEEPLWTISEPVIKCQVVTIDNSLQNGFTQRLLDGKSFPIHFTSFVTQIANAGNTSTPVVSITRAFTRLKAAYITMYKQVYRYVRGAATEEERYRSVECEHLGNAKEATLFYHPQYVYKGADANDGITNDAIDKAPHKVLSLIQISAATTGTTPNAKSLTKFNLGPKYIPSWKLSHHKKRITNC